MKKLNHSCNQNLLKKFAFLDQIDEEKSRAESFEDEASSCIEFNMRKLQIKERQKENESRPSPVSLSTNTAQKEVKLANMESAIDSVGVSTAGTAATMRAQSQLSGLQSKTQSSRVFLQSTTRDERLVQLSEKKSSLLGILKEQKHERPSVRFKLEDKEAEKEQCLHLDRQEVKKASMLSSKKSYDNSLNIAALIENRAKEVGVAVFRWASPLSSAPDSQNISS